MKYLLVLMLFVSMTFAACMPESEAPQIEEENQDSNPPVVEEEIVEPDTQGGVYIDSDYGISFVYPSHWETRETEDGKKMFAVNFDYFDGNADSSTSTEVEGTLIFEVIENTGGADAATHFSKKYSDCMEDSENSEFGPICYQKNFMESEQFEVSGYTAYKFDWEGVPAAGELEKVLIVDIAEKNMILILKGIKTGVTEESFEKVVEEAFESLTIE